MSCALLAIEHMATDLGGRGGILVNVAQYSNSETCAQLPIYTATKWATIGFSQSLGVSKISWVNSTYSLSLLRREKKKGKRFFFNISYKLINLSSNISFFRHRISTKIEVLGSSLYVQV